MKKNSIFHDISKNRFSYLLALPGIIYVFIFSYATIPYMFTAFQKFSYNSGLFNSEFIGLYNFKIFFSSPRAFQVTLNTVKLNFLYIIFGFAVSVLLALLLNEIKNRFFAKISQTLYTLPWFLSWVVASYIIYSIFSTELGVINKLFSIIGIQPVNWYILPAAWTWIIVILRIWKGTGINTVIFLAAITAIDNSLYEASVIDGANRFQQMVRITIPLITPTILTLTLLNIGRMLYGDFGMIYAIIRDNSLLFPSVDIIETYVFRLLRRTGDPSQAMAVGLYQSIIGFVLVFFSNWLTKKISKEGALF